MWSYERAANLLMYVFHYVNRINCILNIVKVSLSLCFIGVLRHMQRYFSHICDGTDVQAD